MGDLSKEELSTMDFDTIKKEGQITWASERIDKNDIEYKLLPVFKTNT